MSKSVFVSDSLGAAVAASEQLIPRLAIRVCYVRKDSQVGMRKIRGIGGSRGYLRVIPLCLGYIHLCNKLLR